MLRPSPRGSREAKLLWEGISVSHPPCIPSFVLPSPLHSAMLPTGLSAVPLLPVCRTAFVFANLGCQAPPLQAGCSGSLEGMLPALGLVRMKDSSKAGSVCFLSPICLILILVPAVYSTCPSLPAFHFPDLAYQCAAAAFQKQPWARAFVFACHQAFLGSQCSDESRA